LTEISAGLTSLRAALDTVPENFDSGMSAIDVRHARDNYPRSVARATSGLRLLRTLRTLQRLLILRPPIHVHPDFSHQKAE
jgi:hypothetical protein